MAKKKHVAKTKKRNVITVQMDATFFFERAVHSLDRNRYDKALKYFRRAVEFEPDNPVNHCNLAGVLSETGNYEESNRILQQIVEQIDPTMTECYFYMANNYANMENYEAAEEALVYYLEHDPNGHFLEESEEMMELLGYELERPTKLTSIKSREGLFEHDKARTLLEEGKFSEAVRILEKLVKKSPDFLAARNNLALAYYYMGLFDKALATIRQVLELEPGNLHALCNLAIFHQHNGDQEQLNELLLSLRKTYPMHYDHIFKLATTMGILSEHETAYRLFRRLLKTGESGLDPCLYHYTAVAACNIGKYAEAEKLWRTVEKLDPGTDIPRYYLEQMKEAENGNKKALGYHYHLPFEEQFRVLEKAADGIPDHMKRDPLVRSSFFWALRHGDVETKLQVIQAFGIIADSEVEDALREFLLDPEEDEYLKKVAIFVLRSMRAKEPIYVNLDGRETPLASSPWSPNLPIWKDKWQEVMEAALHKMDKRYDMIQQHDLETLWVEFLTRVYPDAPKIGKVEGWAAALEYLTAKMHRREISYHEVSLRYGISVTTVSKNVKIIDRACGLKEKMDAIFPKLSSSEPF
ncbi:tetratricopeptide repeat protein [Paenibacillus mesophilus]|uniref:tetratricopeptide repeat protein n=1 Tax=Paenibacillus mesophilus TaxID=2582849 RepID=UPI00110DA411|nr:tetratricopeptide repeat protein [Paenibacillus mesophilus]TMV50956.1 tetratricopeptide repeat protein [Paenibacillus mesophilus]